MKDMTKRLLWMLGMLWTLSAFAQTPSSQVEQTHSQLLSALTQQNYAQFTADGNEQFKAMISEPQFNAVAGQLNKRLTAGYQAQYLTQLNQQGHEVHLWKISFKDQGDDHLTKLALKDGKVAGFWIQ